MIRKACELIWERRELIPKTLWSTSEWPRLNFAWNCKDLQGIASILQGPGRALTLIGKACELIRELREVIWKARELVWERLQLVRECLEHF